MKILITGSSGMLGSELCGLLKREHEVAGMDMIGPQSTVQNPQRFYEADINDKPKVEEVFRSECPDVVIHAAAWTDVDGCERDPEKADLINSKGTLFVSEETQKVNAVLIYISTDFVFDGKKKTPYTETDIPAPISVYGKSKSDGEDHVKNLSKNYVIIRTSWLFGKYGKNFVDTIIKKKKSGEHLKVVDDQIGTPTYAPDLSAVIYGLLNKGGIEKDIYHFSNSGECSWYEFAGAILENLNFDSSSLSPVKTQEILRPARRPRYSVLECSKIRNSLSLNIRSWQDALKEYLCEVM